MKTIKYLYKKTNIIWFPFIIAILVSGCSFLPKEDEVLAPPLVEPSQIDYETAAVQKGEIIRRVQGAGTIISSDIKDLYFSRDGGRLKEIYVSEGDAVEKGQVLAEVDADHLHLEIQQLNIDLKKAELRLSQMQETGADKYSIEIARLDIQSIHNRLNHLNKELSSAKIVSPISGTVVYISDIKQGAHVNAYETLISVAETNDLQIQYTAMSEDHIREVSVGMEVSIKLRDEQVKGEVVQTPQEVPSELYQQNPELYSKTLLIGSDELPKGLNAGDIVEIEIITAQKDDALIIPKAGLRNAGDRHYVQVLEENSRKEIDVEVGIMSSTEIEIVTGLEEGDIIILK